MPSTGRVPVHLVYLGNTVRTGVLQVNTEASVIAAASCPVQTIAATESLVSVSATRAASDTSATCPALISPMEPTAATSASASPTPHCSVIQRLAGVSAVLGTWALTAPRSAQMVGGAPGASKCASVTTESPVTVPLAPVYTTVHLDSQDPSVKHGVTLASLGQGVSSPASVMVDLVIQ